MNHPRQRGALSKGTSKPVLIYFPKELIPILDRAVQLEDLDRSKFIRAAVREKLATLKAAR